MSCSPARLAANRQNALKSTGPRSVPGKAASRLNAVRHGMAGGGDVVAPVDDSKVVAERASAFEVELGASCPVGRTLAHRAALLSVRMERAADRDMAGVADRMAEARDRFDRGRLDEVDGRIAALDRPGEAQAALSALEESPEGVAHLLDVWTELHGVLNDPDVDQRSEATRHALNWLGLGESEAGAIEESGIRARIVAELGRLRSIREAMGPVSRSIAEAREREALRASFDPSPEESLARRYEAAAERGMYHALRAIANLRRARRLDPIPLEVPPKAEVPAPVHSKSAEPPRPSLGPLGSFRAEGFGPISTPPKSFFGEFEPAMPLQGPRKKRPDLRKLAASRR